MKVAIIFFILGIVEGFILMSSFYDKKALRSSKLNK
jgi:uncharacterized membrane protein YciS (DUF1049 family)